MSISWQVPGTPIGGVTFGHPSPIAGGGSAYFDGASGYIDLTADLSKYSSKLAFFEHSEFTMELLFNITNTTPGHDIRLMASGGYPDNAGFNWSLTSNMDAAVMQIGVYNGAPANTIYDGCNPASPYQANTWYHIAYVFSQGYRYMYFDGQAIGTWNPVNNVPAVSALSPTIGRNPRYSPGDLFTGYICEVAIYPRALPKSEIDSHYSKITSTVVGDYFNTILSSLPLGYWRLNEPSGATAVIDYGVKSYSAPYR